MKKITQLLIILLALVASNQVLAQKAVVIGTNHATPDGFAFLVTQDLANGETVYFTEDEYNNSSNVFATGESVVRFTASGAVPTGTVIFVNETSTNTFSTSCCGTAAHFGGSFSLRTDGEAYYAYQDTDTDPGNGVTEIYSVFFTGEVGQATPGGPIPALLDPTPDFPNAIVVDGFPTVSPNRAEYEFAGAGVRDGLCRDNLENVSNYLHAQSNQALSTIAFNSFTLACTSPTVTLTSSPASVAENSGSGITYTFSISPTSASNTTVNFSVSGSATFGSDYGQSGAATFSTTTGTVVINAGASSATVTLTPTGDTTLEPDETAVLTLAAGTGYTSGSPSIATGTITNDDTQNITPVVAVTGMNNAVAPGIEGFSFVALDDIAAGTEVYFTEEEFDINTLAFSALSGEGVVRWTAPAGGVLRGEVIVATENTADTFTATCNSGTCGTFTTIVTGFTFASNGEGFFAYSDSDTDPTNGVGQVHSVLYTGSAGGGPGGNIPALEDPSSVYIGAVVVDGFPAVNPQRTEYNPALRGVTVDQANFQNTSNWLHAQTPATLDTTPFANIIIATGSANPSLIVTASPTSTVEDSGTPIVYTFTLSAAAASDITVNFTVAGSATLTSDYTVSGADTFTATSGTATILMGTTTVAVSVTPVADTTVEPTETVELMIASGTGYDGGSPNSATGSITNDDTSASDPLIAIMGMSHDGTDGFSFAAAQDVPAGTVVYFTEDEFDNTTLLFSSGEAVLQWTSPAGQIDQGDVITVTEGGTPDTFTVACSDSSGNGCGTISVIVGGFAMATNGESLFAYTDGDTDPTNGVTDIYSVMYTGNSTTPGGNLPAVEDPTGIYLNALVVDGFPAVAPDKTEYTPASRAIPVGQADFENPANYDHATAFGAGLSTTPFANLSIVVTFTALADLCIDAGVQTGLGGGTPTGGVYSGPGVTDDGNGMTYSFDPAAAGVGTHTITYTSGGSSASDDVEVFALPTVTFTAPADLCIDAGVQTGLGGGTPTGGVYSGPGVTDDGNGMTYSFDPAAAGVGTHTLTYAFIDTNGCTGSATDTVEVFALPTVTFTALADLCVNAGVQTGIGGGTPTGGVYSGPGVTDDGNGMTYSFDPAAAGVGTHTITYTFTDTNGCTAGATDTVEVFATPTVTFTAPASPVCPNATLIGQGGGTPTGGVYSGPGVTDDGNGMTYTFDAATAGTGTHTITYTFTDANGCTASASDSVTVEDTTPPTISCPADITVNNDAGLCSAVVTFADATGADNCGTVTITQTAGPTSGSAFAVGTTVVSFSATDGSGNSVSCSFNVTVNDAEDPTISCPADITQDNDPGVCGATVTYTTPSGSDNCPGSTTVQIAGLASGSVFPVGTTTNTFEVTDASGNTATCSFDITVNDVEDPTISCPANITVSNDIGVCGALITVPAPTFSDNCSGGLGPIMPFNFDGSGDLIDTPYTLTGMMMASSDVGLNLRFSGDFNGTSECFALNGPDGSQIFFECDIDPVCVITDRTIGIPMATWNNWITTFGNDLTFTLPADGSIDEGQCTSGPENFYQLGLGVAIVNDYNNTADATDFYPVGTTTVNWTVTDVAGNTATCSMDITVNDTEAPILICEDITVELDAAGMASITIDDVTNDTGSYTVDQTGTFNPIDISGIGTDVSLSDDSVSGAIPVGFDFDFYGNTYTEFYISSNGFITFNNDGANGCCTGQLLPDANAPNNLIALAWEDLDPGNGGQPVENVVRYATTGTAPNRVLIVEYFNVDHFSDGLNVTTQAQLYEGTNIIEIHTTNMPTDNGGHTQGIENIDGTRAVTTPGRNSNGTWSATNDFVAFLPAGITDNCGLASTSIDMSSFDCSNVGANTVTVTATDIYGNTATCTATVTVEDNIAPIASCVAPFTVQLDASGSATITTADVDNGSSDACGVTLSLDIDTFDCSDVGTPVTVTLTATDPSGNSASCTTVVTVEDSIDPAITCPADITVDNDPGVCGATVTYATPVGTDNCPASITTQIAGLPSGSVFPVGTTTNTFEVIDASGNAVSCSFDVTVNDVEDPVISCPGDITVSNDLGVCGAQVDYMVTATDNCATVTPGTASINPMKDNSLFQEIPGNSNGAGQLMYVGQNNVALNHRGVLTFDVAGSVPAGATITAVTLTMTADHPTAANGAHDFNLHRLLEDWGEGTSDNGVAPGSGGGGFGVAAIAPDATWNDAMLGTAWASGPGGNFNPASSAVQTVDANGPYNWTSAGLISDVQDMLDNPGANFGWIVIGNETTSGTTKRFGTRESSIAPLLQISYETVTGLTITQTAGLPSGSVFPVGTTTNTFVVTDAAGNTDTCSFDITVNDTEPPVAVCQDITIQLDATGNASITAADIDNGSTDNCGIASLAVSPSTFDCSNVGANTVTLTVTDIFGNSSTCTATVTVEDNVAPDAVCMDIDVFLDATGNASITPSDVDGGSSDACGIASLAIDITDFTCADVGPNDVTLTVTDVNGNSSSCIAVVTVIDNTAPVISCPADVLTGTDPGLCSAQVVFSDAIGSDECGIASVVQTAGLPSGSDFPVGVSTIEFTATDVNGNTTTCSFTITVEDDEPAMAVCQDITIQLDDSGNATITAADIDGGSTDNCGIASLDVSPDTFDCSNVGDNTVTLTVTDDNGNTSTCTAIVTVEDVTAPEVFCQDIIVDLDDTGTVTILPTDVDNGSTDACGIATYELDIDTFDCSNVGDNVVTLTVTDVNGNSSTCTAIVTVQDVTDPVLTCMDITVELDENGEAVITPEDVIDTLDDACGIFTTAIDIFEFSCDDIGTPITVQVFANDVNGNLATCTATVTVVDALAPELTCPADQTVDPGPGNLFYEIPDYFATGEATATDNCTDPVTDVTQDPAPGTLVPDGVYTITLTATDESGNTATCTFELTVESVLGLDDLPVDLSTIVMYPNPATDVVFISNPQNIVLEKVTLYDLVGRKVATYDLRNAGIETSLDISNLATASYTVVIEGSGGQINKRLIKE